MQKVSVKLTLNEMLKLGPKMTLKGLVKKLGRNRVKLAKKKK